MKDKKLLFLVKGKGNPLTLLQKVLDGNEKIGKPFNFFFALHSQTFVILLLKV